MNRKHNCEGLGVSLHVNCRPFPSFTEMIVTESQPVFTDFNWLDCTRFSAGARGRRGPLWPSKRLYRGSCHPCRQSHAGWGGGSVVRGSKQSPLLSFAPAENMIRSSIIFTSKPNQLHFFEHLHDVDLVQLSFVPTKSCCFLEPFFFLPSLSSSLLLSITHNTAEYIWVWWDSFLFMTANEAKDRDEAKKMALNKKQCPQICTQLSKAAELESAFWSKQNSVLL